MVTIVALETGWHAHALWYLQQQANRLQYYPAMCIATSLQCPLYRGGRGVYLDTDVDVIFKDLPEKQRPRDSGSEGTTQAAGAVAGHHGNSRLSDHSSQCGRRPGHVWFASAAGRQVSGSLPKVTLWVQQCSNLSLNLPFHSVRCKAELTPYTGRSCGPWGNRARETNTHTRTKQKRRYKRPPPSSGHNAQGSHGPRLGSTEQSLHPSRDWNTRGPLPLSGN